jgi:transitional endoplasmic reticulum ATPase
MSTESGQLSEEALRALREAARLAPNNVPLGQHFAQALAGNGCWDEAEQEYRRLLTLKPENHELKLGLAAIFWRQNKTNHALVLVEDLVKGNKPLPAALMLHARLCYRAGEIPLAVRSYYAAVEADPSLADAELKMRLGIRASPRENEVVEGRVALPTEDGPEDRATTIEHPKISFRDIGGMDGLKDEIRMKIIHPLAHPELFKAYGKTIGGGILMYGPPGCGKTYLARATAGEINASFIAVGINEVLEMWIGQSERNLHEIFEQARSHTPCVLFFDEVDALGASRSDMRQSAGRQLINQFLSEFDGVQRSNEGVLILAATNAPWHLDPAFRRPGRFDRILFVPPPDSAARAAILRIQCKGKPIEEIDFDHVVKKCDHFSGADLKAVVDVAIEMKLRDAMKAGVPKPLTSKDLLHAAGQVRPSTKEWFATARNYALYSNQGGIYDDILNHLKLK